VAGKLCNRLDQPGVAGRAIGAKENDLFRPDRPDDNFDGLSSSSR